MKNLSVGLVAFAALVPWTSGKAAEIAPIAPYSRSAARKLYTRPSAIPFPADNPFSAEKALLGRTLFFDPRLSGSRFISCATCHHAGFSWGDGLPKGIGHGMKTLGRRTPTILNAAWMELLFWDGRTDSLEQQALGPIAAPGEMNQDLPAMIATIGAIPEYRSLFARAYPKDPIDANTVAKAIATFERTVVSGRAPFDAWISGQGNAISAEAKQGFDLFNTKAACAKCHSGWAFTDNGFHDIGIQGDDLGRGKLLKLESMQHAFKTPTLRNADRRGPYMHDGSGATLEQVVDFYDKGGDDRRPSLSPEISALHLTAAEKHKLIVFLKTLTSVDRPVSVPLLPR